MPDTGSSIEGISDVHLHKADSSSSTFLLRPLSLSPPSQSHSLASCSLPCRRLLPSTSAIWKHFHFLFAPPPFYLGSARVLVVSLLYVLLPLFIVPFNPVPSRTSALLCHILLISPLCFSEELECLLHARISLLNLVLQVTILLLSPVFSMIFFLPLFNTFIVSR